MSNQDSQRPDDPGDEGAPDLSQIGSWDEFDAIEARKAAKTGPSSGTPHRSAGAIDDFKVDDLNFGQLPDEVKAQIEGRPASTRGWGDDGWGSPRAASHGDARSALEDTAQGDGAPLTSSSQPPSSSLALTSTRASQGGSSTFSTDFDADEVERGKGMAVLSHMSYLTMLPLFAIPMLLRENRFALHHARQAGAGWIALVGVQMVALGVTMVTCGLFPVLIPLPFVMTVVMTIMGITWALKGEVRRFPILNETGDKLFANVTVQKQLR